MFLENMTRYQEGVTLIEMITVIIILVVISVVATHKYADFKREARIAVLKQAENITTPTWL